MSITVHKKIAVEFKVGNLYRVQNGDIFMFMTVGYGLTLVCVKGEKKGESWDKPKSGKDLTEMLKECVNKYGFEEYHGEIEVTPKIKYTLNEKDVEEFKKIFEDKENTTPTKGAIPDKPFGKAVLFERMF